jgi:carboxymethylenebutenolidase
MQSARPSSAGPTRGDFVRQTLPSGTPIELVEPGRARSVVICPDVRGLRSLFDDLAARLADDQSWSVAVVEPCPGLPSDDRKARLAAVATRADRPVLADLIAAADRLDAERTAVLGFCVGGMYAMKAAVEPRFDRFVAFYGMIRLPSGWRLGGQRDALELVRESGRAERVLALVAGRDPLTPGPDADALKQLGARVRRFPDADHAFAHDPEWSAYDARLADKAWREAMAWLA